jgi:hypothetical protein
MHLYRAPHVLSTLIGAASLSTGCSEDSDTTQTTSSGGTGGTTSSSSGSGGSGATGGSSSGTGGSAGSGGSLVGELEGYGTTSSFGSSGDTCTVTSLDDSGAGTLRDCVENRDGPVDNPTPLTVVFTLGGTIEQLSDLRIRQPYLTIDGLSAPAPGITIKKLGDGTDGETIINTWPPNNTCGHDVLVQGIRFVGVWTATSEDHSQNAATIALDGEDLPLCLKNVVLNRVTVTNAQDSGGDIWGSVTDVTFQYSAFLRSLHPNTYSHFPGDVADQQRERISNHHNLYAAIHERGPQIVGNVWDLNVEQTIFHNWAAFGFGGGYEVRIRCRDTGCPERVNLIENHWTSFGANLSEALLLGDSSGAGDDGSLPAQLFMSGNRLPTETVDSGNAASEFPRAAEAAVTLVADNELVGAVLPLIGAPHRTAEEEAIFAEVATQIGSEL